MLAEPAALAPEAGREQLVGEVSAPAEAFGVAPGMRVGEALARCPELRLVPPDPEAVRGLWGEVLDRLEAIGAAPESERAGAAFFEAGGLTGIHGGRLEGVLAAARRALGRTVRLGAAPSRFASYAAALQARPRRRPVVVLRAGTPPASSRRCPSPCCAPGPSCRPCPRCSSGSASARSASWPRCPRARWRSASAIPGCSRSTSPGGATRRSSPRRPPEPVVERLELPEAASGQQLERALELLVARLLARRERRGRTLRALALSARFVAGGTWRLPLVAARPERRPGAAAPAAGAAARRAAGARRGAARSRWRRSARRHATRAALIEDPAAGRRARLGEAVRQVRQAAGPEAALRVLEVDSESRVPGAARRAGAVPGGGARLTPAGPRRSLGAPAPRRASAPAAAAPPRRSAAVPVEAVREEWVVEDRWWTGRPLRRRYFELVLANGATRSSSSTCAPAAGSSSGPDV